MPVRITTEEAKKQSLPGFDVYRYAHLLYHDDLNRRQSANTSVRIGCFKADFRYLSPKVLATGWIAAVADVDGCLFNFC